MMRTLGAPSGAFSARYGVQSGVESRMSRSMTPRNGFLGMRKRLGGGGVNGPHPARGVCSPCGAERLPSPAMGLSPTAGLCEDDADLRGVVRDVLAREGFAVRATATGSEAVAAFGADPPDVLILDVGLPDADGRDVCQALRAAGVDTPVLFLTARDALADRLSGFHAGGDDYLTKQFALAELLV